MPKCYLHRDIEAVAVCKACGKAICANCSVSVNEVSFCMPCAKAREEAIGARASQPPTYIPHFLGLVLPGLAQILKGEPLKGVFFLTYFILAASAGMGFVVLLSYVVSTWDYFSSLVPENAQASLEFEPRIFFGSTLIISGLVLLIMKGLEDKVSQSLLVVLISALTITLGIVIVLCNKMKGRGQAGR